jgi:hypothetical protein
LFLIRASTAISLVTHEYTTGAEEIGAMSHMRKQAIQCNLFASGASDATTEEGTWTTSESDKDEWYIEEYASGYSSQTHEESSQGASGMMTSNLST